MFPFPCNEINTVKYFINGLSVFIRLLKRARKRRLLIEPPAQQRNAIYNFMQQFAKHLLPLIIRNTTRLTADSHCSSFSIQRPNSMEQSGLKKLIPAQLVKKSPPPMNPEGSFPCSQLPAIGPYPEPDAFSPNSHTYFFKMFSYFPSIYA